MSARLVLTIDGSASPGNWGPDGRLVEAHRLLADWIEGNGKNSEIPPSERYRGDGAGVTWNCAVDADNSDENADCDPAWNGGEYEPTASASALHTNGIAGEVQWDVTEDVLAGADTWILMRAPGGGGHVLYFSKEGGGPPPKLILDYGS